MASPPGPPVDSGRRSGPRQRAVQGFTRQFPFQDLAHRNESLRVNSGGKPAALAKIHKILEHDVSGRPRGKGAPAEPADGPVKYAYAGLKCRIGIGDTGAAGVVQVNLEGKVPEFIDEPAAKSGNLCRSGKTDRVRHRQGFRPGFGAVPDQAQHVIGADLAGDRASECNRHRRVDNRTVARDRPTSRLRCG